MLQSGFPFLPPRPAPSKSFRLISTADTAPAKPTNVRWCRQSCSQRLLPPAFAPASYLRLHPAAPGWWHSAVAIALSRLCRTPPALELQRALQSRLDCSKGQRDAEAVFRRWPIWPLHSAALSSACCNRSRWQLLKSPQSRTIAVVFEISFSSLPFGIADLQNHRFT